jgi:hypothetical protein
MAAQGAGGVIDSAEGAGPQKNKGNGEFFRIDSRVWAKVTAYDMNAAAAYLVLASGTGHGNTSTSWSTKSVMGYAGIGHERAKAAIQRLSAGGFIRRAEAHTEARPRYELATYQELIEHEHAKNPPPEPGFYEREALCDLQAGKQPTNKKERNRAEGLYQRGLLSKDAQGIYKLSEPLAENSGEYSIWLPNAIVTATSHGEESPVQRLRSAGCIWTLRLFVDLYTAQNLRDDGGISPLVVRAVYERKQIGQQGTYVIWGFKQKQLAGQYSGPFAPHSKRQPKKANDDPPVWDSVHLLQRMGLLSFVPHIFDNETETAEPIHVYGLGETAEAPIEREIGAAANRAARAMCLPSKLLEAESDGFEYYCPILSTKPTAQMVGVARLTYRPRTRRTAAWFDELHKNGAAWIEAFNKLAEKGEKASLRRTANYA